MQLSKKWCCACVMHAAGHFVNGCLGFVGLYNRFVLAHNVARVCRRSRVICKQVSDYAMHCISSMTSIHSFTLPWDVCACIGFLVDVQQGFVVTIHDCCRASACSCWLIHKLAHL